VLPLRLNPSPQGQAGCVVANTVDCTPGWAAQQYFVVLASHAVPSAPFKPFCQSMIVNELVAACALQVQWFVTLLPAASTSEGTARAGCLAGGCAFVVSRCHRGHAAGSSAWPPAWHWADCGNGVSSPLCQLLPKSMPLPVKKSPPPPPTGPTLGCHCQVWFESGPSLTGSAHCLASSLVRPACSTPAAFHNPFVTYSVRYSISSV